MNLNKSNNSLLVLPSWYPSVIDPSSGDFIQRHVEAIALYKNEYVIYVVKDEKAEVTKTEKTFITQKNNFTEEVIYYHPPKTKFRIINKIISQFYYKKVYKKAIKKYLETYGIPKLVQVHVAQKAGLLALWINKKYKIPFVLSEHWTAYLPEADLKISDHSKLFQLNTKRIFKAAKLVTVVSAYLGLAIKNLYPFIQFTIIPNVVNEQIIEGISENSFKTEKKVFVHASTQNFQKNTEAILEAFALLKEEPHISLQLFGPTPAQILKKIKSLGIENLVEVKGNVSQEQLFQHIKIAKAVILYSRFETFGCVLIEANALGVPAIVSNHNVFKDIILPGVNGLYAGNDNPEILAKSIKHLVNHPEQFQTERIKESAKKYSYREVGLMFEKIFP